MINFPRLPRAASFALLLVAAGGCSATDHTAAVTRFAEATVAAETALTGLNQAVTAQYTAYLEQQVLTGSDSGPTIRSASRECGLISTRCRIVIVDPNAAESEQPFPPEPLLSNMVTVMGDIRAYAQNLKDLLADDSAAKAETSVNAALGSIETLAGTLGSNGSSPAPSFATPVGAGVNWLVGQYANHVKLEGLREATSAADPVIQEAAMLFQESSVFGSDPQRIDLSQRFGVAIGALEDDRESRSNLTATVNAAAIYDRFLVALNTEIFRKMGEAHAALTEGLEDPDISLPEMFRKIEDFASAAKELSAIVRDLNALTSDQ